MRTHSATRSSKTSTVILWGLQGLLALLFLFAGASKLAMPAEVLANQSGLPGGFMKFIGVAEVCGAFGLILPGLLRLRSFLTPLAGAGLVVIMIGATILTIARQGLAPSLFPFVVGILLLVVIRGRIRSGLGRAMLAACRLKRTNGVAPHVPAQ